MQKKIVALAVAGLSTAAFAQTNVTIYGVADLSGQGINYSKVKNPITANASDGGNVFALQSNSSLIGFKGTEDLGNGLKALFQAETELNLAGNRNVDNGTAGTGTMVQTRTSMFINARDSYVGLNSKYGTGLAGYISTPFRSTLTSFDVMPGAAGVSQIDVQMGSMRLAGATGFSSSLRGSAVAYAMPTLYGFDASVAYAGSNLNGASNSMAPTACSTSSACSITPISAWGFNLGWTGYGVSIKGAFQQANNNVAADTLGLRANQIGDYTSYLVGAQYTGLANLKTGVVYVRNSLGTNGANFLTTNGAGKISNNQLWAGASYRMGNWEPAVSASWSSDMDGSSVQQLGSRQWTARVGYYLSKRTQVYGNLSNLNNSANQGYLFGAQTSALGNPASGSLGGNLFTYGAGMRTTF